MENQLGLNTSIVLCPLSNFYIVKHVYNKISFLKGTLESLTTEQATAIVARHVIPGATVMAADVATGTVGTFGGEDIDLVKTEEGGVQVVYNGNTVNVVAADVGASNGVIHVIDSVIL